MTEIIIRIVPILLLLTLGNVIRVRRLLSDATVEELKRLVVMVALPAVLFLAFLEMEMERSYLGLFLVILIICLGQLAYGYLLQRALSIRFEYYPFLMTGFEFGMVGISLFGSAYGLRNVGYLAIVDLSHELFIWFVLVTILRIHRDGARDITGTLKGFASSPLILAIVLAIVLNLAGLHDAFFSYPATKAIAETLGLLGNLLIPTILIIIGFGMGLSLQGIRDAAAVVASRLVVLLPLAFFVSRYVVRYVLALEPAFEVAVFTFLILPPPYIIPLFIKKEDTMERNHTNNVLSVYTIVSLAIFIVYFTFNPTLG